MSGTQSDGRRDRDAYEPAQPQPKLPPDTVTLQVAGQNFSGWTDIRIIRGIEVFPSVFSLQVTERLPKDASRFPISPGQQCKLMIGDDLVLTGFVDSYEARVSTHGHEVTVTGRSATQDLVDCAAGFTSGKENYANLNRSSPSLIGLAQWLCSPLGISVTEPDGEGRMLVSISDRIPQETLPLGITPYQVIERHAQLRQMLLIDGTDRNLILAKVGTAKAASGFTLPGSVVEAQTKWSKQDRFSVYIPASFPTDQAFDVSAALGKPSSNFHIMVHDDAAFRDQPRYDGSPRYRPHVVISDQYVGDPLLCEALAKWECARRFGRSQAVNALVPLWRDSAGKLWTPNTLAPVDMPVLKLEGLTWLISQVVYLKSFGQGTRTAVVLMPKEAFEPEPGFETPFDPQISQADRQSLETGRASTSGGGQFRRDQ